MNPTNYRIIDANLNRAREALRVIEEYCRFVLNNAASSERLKRLRNVIASISAKLDDTSLLQSRDTLRDVGTSISASNEIRRSSTQDVVRANFKRLQEALRVLEEYLKTSNEALALAAQNARYDCYTLEKELNASDRRTLIAQCSLMLVVGSQDNAVDVMREAHFAGVRCFQLRSKQGSDKEILAHLQSLMKVARTLDDTLVIINDRCDFALSLEADGVHLGQDDTPLERAREVLGDNMLIGLSTHNVSELKAGQAADYFGAGAMFESSTKSVVHLGGPAWGVEASAETQNPVFCIGGITLENAKQLKVAGVSRIAVSAAICGAKDPASAAAEFLTLFPAMKLGQQESHEGDHGLGKDASEPSRY